MLNWRRRLGLLGWVAVVLLVHQWLMGHFGGWQPLGSAPPPRLVVQLTKRLEAKALAPRAAPARPPTRTRNVSAMPATPASPDAAASEPAVAASVPVQAEPPASSVAASTAAVGTDVSPEWPLSTQLRYTVLGNYRGAVHGDAEVEWLRQGARYQVRLRVGIGPKAAPFGQRRLISEGLLTPQGISPRRYDEETQQLWVTGRALTIWMDADAVTLPNGRRWPAQPGVQDSASQFVHLTWLLLTGREPARAGHVIELPLALPQLVSAWRYRLEGEVPVDTPLGRIATWHVKPLPPIPMGVLSAQAWLAPSYQYLPVKIRIEQGEDVWLELTLAEAPLQEAPKPENPPNPLGENKP